jgi:hypothetical protein
MKLIEYYNSSNNESPEEDYPEWYVELDGPVSENITNDVSEPIQKQRRKVRMASAYFDFSFLECWQF